MTDEEIISRSNAEALLGAYGADPKRWPAEWREALDRAIAYHVGLKELAEQTNANELFLHCSSYGVSERIAALEIIAEDWGLNAEQRPKAVLG